MIPPDFLESYWKYACTFLSVLSPMILTLFLLAPTVPSAPRPQNLHDTVPSAAVSGFDKALIERFVTSSSIETVNLCLGSFDARLSNTATISPGCVSFEPSPYLPPIIFMSVSASASAISRYRGSPIEPGSLHLSRTAILLTD